jgi:MoxR-like ATPase
MDKLVLLNANGQSTDFSLHGQEVAIGRGPECAIRLSDTNVSRLHAKIVREGANWTVVDVNSRFGTKVNGEKKSSHTLKVGDVIEVGSTKLKFDSLASGTGFTPAVGPGTSGKAKSEISQEMIDRLKTAREQIIAQVGKVIVGQRDAIEQMLIALFARGHCLLVGVPGLAKTLMVRSLASALDLEFKRIQFTPDLMPSDITGTEVLDDDQTTKERVFRFIKGPIFTNILLADEINRTPPKTQAALLEAMQEHRVTAAGYTHSLNQPFFVLATQNPIEQEGTYPLPEAQLDRFMFMLRIDYPERKDEVMIVQSTTQDEVGLPDRVIAAEEIVELQKMVRKLPVSDYVATFATDLVRATRPKTVQAPKFVNDYVTWGAGPRAAQYLVLGAKARALLNGRVNVSCSDVRTIAPMVLRHRIFTNFNADAEGITSEKIVDMLCLEIKDPEAKDLPW